MEFVIGVILVDKAKGERALLSWGRLHSSVDPEKLLAQLRRVVPLMGGLRDVVDIEICSELAGVSDFEYFFEGLLAFSARYSELQMSESGIEDELARLESDDTAFRKTLYLLGNRRHKKSSR